MGDVKEIELVKCGHHYIFRDNAKEEMLRSLGTFVDNNPDSNFTWYNVCVINKEVENNPSRKIKIVDNKPVNQNRLECLQ